MKHTSEINTEINSVQNKLAVYSLFLYFISLPLGAVNLFESFGSVLKLIALLPISAILISGKARLKFKLESLFLFLYLTCIMISWFFSVFPENTLQRIETYIMFFLLFLLTTGVNFTSFEKNKLMSALVWSSRITCFLMLVLGTVSSITEGRLAMTSVFIEDPNYLCGYLLFGIVNAVRHLIFKEKRRTYFIVLAELAFYLYAIFATGSRGGLIAVVIAGLIVFLFERKNSSGKKAIGKKITAITILILTAILVLNILPKELVGRFTLEYTMKDHGAQRFLIWKTGINIFKDSSTLRKLFGYGAGTITFLMGQAYHQNKVMHNIFLEQLLDGGIINLFIYIALIWSFVYKSIKNKNYFSVAVLGGFIALSMSASLSTFKPYWNAMIFACLYSESDNKLNQSSSQI